MMPAGLLVICAPPAPPPLSSYRTATSRPTVLDFVNVAVTVVFRKIWKLQGPVSVHGPPDHPANTEPGAAAAFSSTDEPGGV